MRGAGRIFNPPLEGQLCGLKETQSALTQLSLPSAKIMDDSFRRRSAAPRFQP
jgi:hypothetical protein